jgi:hypothetical protein
VLHFLLVIFFPNQSPHKSSMFERFVFIPSLSMDLSIQKSDLSSLCLFFGTLEAKYVSNSKLIDRFLSCSLSFALSLSLSLSLSRSLKSSSHSLQLCYPCFLFFILFYLSSILRTVYIYKIVQLLNAVSF